MNGSIVERIADAILYEGYILYPYRPSSVKNRQRWNFGGLCPRSYSEAQQGTERWRSQTECLITGGDQSSLRVKVRFLHLVDRRVARVKTIAMDVAELREPDFEYVDSIRVGGRAFQNWQEAGECNIELPEILFSKMAGNFDSFNFSMPASRAIEGLGETGGQIEGALIRSQNPLELEVRLSVNRLDQCLFKLRLEVLNLSPLANANRATRSEAMMFSLVSSHLILHVENGEFVSLLDTPPEFSEATSQCENLGLFPVLVGENGSRSTMLSSPVILYDYPQIAPESAGDLFDGTEIDEILTLRIMALTDQEKAEMRQADDRARRILERIESNPEHLARLHGAIRSIQPTLESGGKTRASSNATEEWTNSVQGWSPFEEKPKLESVNVWGTNLRVGDRVRLRPYKNADIMDMALAGQIATIEAIEQDYDENVHLAVILEDDPGRDLGELRQPGHRFFFTPDEVEPVNTSAPASGVGSSGNL
jgi:hypothetical protein